MSLNRRRRGQGGQLGQNMAELALLLPLLLTILLGTIDIGRAFYTYIALTNAAREAARYAAVNETNASSAQVTQEFTTSGGSNISGCASGSLQVAGSGGGAMGNAYTVTVSCRFNLVTPFIGAVVRATGNQISINSTATFVWD